MDPHAERHAWEVPSGVTYLNHGSFGLMPTVVRNACRQWRERMDDEPMDFYVRVLEPIWFESRAKLATFLGSSPDNLALIDNATSGMNVVANSVVLRPGDEVLLNDHEYGAVHRIWERACRRQQTGPPIVASLSGPVESAEQLVDQLWQSVTPRTRIIVISHITSATAITFPVESICRRAANEGILTCIDGPHAVGQLPLELDDLECDFYVASCHKWLCAPLGSGFLHVNPQHHKKVEPLVLSWGRIMPERPRTWAEEFLWVGTRDFSPLLTLAATLDFWTPARLAAYRTYSYQLASYAHEQLKQFSDRSPLIRVPSGWYTSMAHVPLPPGPTNLLQNRLWKEFKIEVPIIEWRGQRYIRVSCHLYNEPRHIDYLVDALKKVA